MNFGTVLKAFDVLVGVREVARRMKGPPSTEELALRPTQSGGLTGAIEDRLTNIVVAALKEAFERDHARLELERQQLEEQRRRAEAAMRVELRRQAADREVGRLRLLAGIALGGWIASVAISAARLGSMSTASRALIIVGWLTMLGALASAFTAQTRVGALVSDPDHPLDSGFAGAAALWLLVAGLALSSASLLF